MDRLSRGGRKNPRIGLAMSILSRLRLLLRAKLTPDEVEAENRRRAPLSPGDEDPRVPLPRNSRGLRPRARKGTLRRPEESPPRVPAALHARTLSTALRKRRSSDELVLEGLVPRRSLSHQCAGVLARGSPDPRSRRRRQHRYLQRSRRGTPSAFSFPGAQSPRSNLGE